MNKLLNNFQEHFDKYLSGNQFQTLLILIGLLNQYKEVKIEKLATYFPLPILFQSRRKHIQRFLMLKKLSISLIWFPIISTIIDQQFSLNFPLIIALDRTQWKNNNIFMISIIWHKKNRKNKNYQEPWYILTSLNNVEDVFKIYSYRSGIETMFKDCKTGGYNLEGSFANITRLTNIILLIAIAYTNKALHGQIIKKKGQQKYIGRPEEEKRKTRRHSEFWLGLYGEIWCDNYENYFQEIEKIMTLNKNKLFYYQQGLKAMEKIKKVYE